MYGMYRAADTVTYGLLMMNELVLRNMYSVQNGLQ